MYIAYLRNSHSLKFRKVRENDEVRNYFSPQSLRILVRILDGRSLNQVNLIVIVAGSRDFCCQRYVDDIAVERVLHR